MNRAAATPTRQPATDTSATAAGTNGKRTGEPTVAVTLLFHLGELTATPEAVAAARAAGVQVVEAVLRHLGGDWGAVDPATWAANDNAVAAGGTLRSRYPLADVGDAIVVTTDAERRHTNAALASQTEPTTNTRASAPDQTDARDPSTRRPQTAPRAASDPDPTTVPRPPCDDRPATRAAR